LTIKINLYETKFMKNQKEINNKQKVEFVVESTIFTQ